MRFNLNHNFSPKTKAAFAAFALGFCTTLGAQDLESQAEAAKTSFNNTFKLGLGVFAGIVMATGIALAAWKFKEKDPNALHYLIGCGAASALLGIAAYAI